MTRRLIPFLLALLTVGQFAFANCEADLTTEFGRTPNDLDRGFVTDQIPMSVQSLRAAYAKGLFPWEIASNGMPGWFSPSIRGVLLLAEVDIPRSDRKAIRKLRESGRFQVKFDTDFRQVITEAALQTRSDGRWISDQQWDPLESTCRHASLSIL